MRGLACRPRTEIECCNTIKRYYSQLHSLQNRFPLSSDSEILNFAWKDIYSGSTWHTSNIRYEMASILYNIAALHSKLGVEEERVDPESMKLACTHFQCAAWAFGEVKNQYGLLLRNDLSAELMIFMQQICFAQAQECILEKSLADNRKAAIIAKVTAQVISFYNAAMSALFSQNEDGTIQELIGNKLYKEWLKYIKFKTSYLSAILFLYQGQNSEEQRKMGERLALYNAACDKLEEAKKETKGMNKIDIINEAMVLATDIIEGKRKNAKQENEFIYHEAIPEISTISAVQGANLVQGISFDVTDPQIIGEDIFKRLVPMKAHENLSLYSEEKAQILRRLSAKIDERDAELTSFMGSLNLEILNAMKQPQERLPQNLVDRCAELNAKPNAISDLIESMSNLGNICAEVEMSLNDIKQILDDETKQEQSFQKEMGKRPTGHMTELTREFTKYLDAHSKAGESNNTLRKAMELHVSNLKILAQPLSALKSQVPQCDVIDENVRKELELLLNKVEEMKTQRDGIYNDLRDQILNKDDITPQLIANGDKDIEELFKKELKKYSQSVSIIEQNLVAQGNILKALTDTYAKHAMTLKAFNDIKSKREQFYSSLINSFDVYEDLLSKSAKGLDFYKKLHGNIQKLMSRVKAARDVQEEERQQLLKNALPKAPLHVDKSDNITKMHTDHSIMQQPIQLSNPISQQTPTSGMKLKDYIKSGMVPNIASLRDDSKIPAIRPSPVGQENIPASMACSNLNYPPTSSFNSSQYYQQNMYANQQYMMNQNTNNNNINNKMVSSANFINPSSSVPSAYSQTSNSTGFINPMYQTSQIYNDMNAYNQTNYSTYQNVQPQYSQQPQQQQIISDQKQVVPPSVSNIQTPTSNTNIYAGQYYNNNQQHQQQQHVPQSPAFPNQNQSNIYNSPQNTVDVNPQNIPQNQQIVNSMAQPQNSTATNTQTQTSTSYNPSNNSYYQQPTNGEFIQNIYKSQLQYPTVQSPVQNYPATSFMQNSIQNPPSQVQVADQSQNTQYNNNYTGFQQTSQQSSQYYQNVSYPYNNLGTNSTSSIPQQSQVTQSAMYYQNNTPQSMANTSVSIQNQPTPSSMQNNINNATISSTAGNIQPQATQSNIYYQNNMQSAVQSQTINTPIQSHAATPQNVQVGYGTSNIQPQYYANTNTQILQNNTTPVPQSSPATPLQNVNQQPQTITPKPAPKSENIDLLSDIDFSISNIPLLTPISITATPTSNNNNNDTDKKDEKVTTDVKDSPKKKPEVAPIIQSPIKMNADLDDLDFSSLTMTTISSQVIKPDKIEKPKKFEDPFEDVNVLKQFHKEVESLEKYMETLTVKTLNGITPLANKWKELQDLLVKDESSRSISIAKLFPDKNRFSDFLPYDHGRVLLPTATDNYINAALVKDCGPVPFIIAQIPMENTLNDYWDMIWSQKSNVIVCLYTNTEVHN